MLRLAILAFGLSSISCKSEEPVKPVININDFVAPPAKEYTFATTPFWADEFDKAGLPDASKWGYDVGNSGWGNNELQNYTNANIKNAHIENGILTIEAIKETAGSSAYTSARIVTKGKNDFLYGRVEARAKIPAGRGNWPAIWMLASQSDYGAQYWPDNGEIDISELIGLLIMCVLLLTTSNTSNSKIRKAAGNNGLLTRGNIS